MKVKPNNNGITLIVLVITIIVLLILAVISIEALMGENGIITQALHGKFATEVKEIQEELEIKIAQGDYNGSGTINDELDLKSSYNDLLYVEEGKLVYIPSKTSEREKRWLEQLGINAQSDYFTVTFETSGGTEIQPQTIKSGEKVKKPSNPTKEGYEFEGWYFSKETGSGENINFEEILFDFNTEILSNYSLYAKYVGEAKMISRNNNMAFWQEKYRKEITSVTFKKVDEIIVPENAIERWDVNENGTSKIVAYIVSDENTGYNLYIVSKYEIFAPTVCGRYFQDFTNLISIDFTNFNTSRVKSMDFMLADNVNLKQVNIELLKTSMVTSMYNIFMNCKKLENLNLSRLNTSSVTTMSGMFYNCVSLQTLNLNNFDTSKVTSLASMFTNCENLEVLDLNNFRTSQVISMGNMFGGCTKLKNLYIANFDTSKVTSMREMFNRCANLKSLDLSRFKTDNVTDMRKMFCATGLINLDIGHFNTEKVTTFESLFDGSSSLESIDLNNWNTLNVTTMLAMFKDCTSLREVHLENFNTSNVTAMANMFWNCSKIEMLDLRSFDTGKVESVVQMFMGCKSMKEIKVGSKWDITNAVKSNMFLNCNVKSVTVYQ